MHWTDTAIIISTRKHGESCGIASLLTSEYGLYKGLVRGIWGKKQRGTYQIGNFVETKWSGRLPEHLGSFTSEVIFPNAALLLSEPKKLAALSSICALLDACLSERESAPKIFNHLKNFIEHMHSDNGWELYYVMFEIELLAYLGFGLDLSSCAATGRTSDLIYISPKSGCAVSKEAGEPYRNKLFKLPSFLIDSNEPVTSHAIVNTLEICSYFLEKHLFRPHNTKLPVARSRFVAMLG